MLLALWFDFWDPAAWTGGASISVSVAPVVIVNSIGGTKQGAEYYDRAPEEYWAARESFLRSKLPVVASAAVRDTPEVAKLVSRHRRVIAAAPKYPDTQQMVRMTKTLNELAAKIKKIELDQDDEDVIALLLM